MCKVQTKSDFNCNSRFTVHGCKRGRGPPVANFGHLIHRPSLRCQFGISRILRVKVQTWNRHPQNVLCCVWLGALAVLFPLDKFAQDIPNKSLSFNAFWIFRISLTINKIHSLILQLVFWIVKFLRRDFARKWRRFRLLVSAEWYGVPYTEMGCQPFQEHCQIHQEYVNLSSITSDNNIRKRAKKCQPKSGKDIWPWTVNREFRLQRFFKGCHVSLPPLKPELAPRFATSARRSTIPFWEGACFSRHLRGLVAGHRYTAKGNRRLILRPESRFFFRNPSFLKSNSDPKRGTYFDNFAIFHPLNANNINESATFHKM